MHFEDASVCKRAATLSAALYAEPDQLHPRDNPIGACKNKGLARTYVSHNDQACKSAEDMKGEQAPRDQEATEGSERGDKDKKGRAARVEYEEGETEEAV